MTTIRTRKTLMEINTGLDELTRYLTNGELDTGDLESLKSVKNRIDVLLKKGITRILSEEEMCDCTGCGK